MIDQRNAVTWTSGGWSYKLAPEGHLWRFTAEHEYTDNQGEKHVQRPDFGLVPGGAAVAIAELVQYREAAEPWLEPFRRVWDNPEDAAACKDL